MLDVIILNAYHRGDWLVEQYKGTQYAVETLDISDIVGPRDEVDLHGPFGLFTGTDAETEEWLSRHREVEMQKDGWVLWTDQGTFQSKGLFRGYQTQLFGEMADTVLKSWLSTTDRPAQMLRTQPALLPQTENGYILSKKFLTNPEKRRTVKGTDAFSVTSTPSSKTVKWNENVFEAHYVVSFMLPHELMARAPLGLNQLLTSEPLKPRLCWQRARFRLETSFNLNSLPKQLTMVSRINDPWFEENMLVVQKTAVENELDIWFRTWYDVHKEKKYFSGLQKRLQNTLLAKFTDGVVTCIQAPLETTEKIAHSLYPVYDLQEWSLQTKFFTGGILYGAQDKCEDYSPPKMLDIQRRIFKQIDEELKRG